MLEANEPVHLKKEIRKLFDEWFGETWNEQALAVWFGNKIPRYLWIECDWKEELSKEGWKWQNFLRLISRRTNDLIHWVNDFFSWDDLIKRIKEDLEDTMVARYCRVKRQAS